MSALKQTRATNFLNAEFGAGTYAARTGSCKVRLLSAAGDQATAGTEIAAGGSYAAGGVAMTFAAAAVATGTYSGTIANAAFSQANMPATTVNAVDVTDSAGTPVPLAFGALTTPRTTNAGDTLSFAAGSLTVSI